MTDERDEIRRRIDIVDLVGRSVQLKKAGKTWKGLCPFHSDRNPSFVVDPTFQSYRCWSCGEHGDVFTWVMKTRNVEFREALEFLAEMAGVSLQNRAQGPSKGEKTRWAQAMNDALEFFKEQLSKSEAAHGYCERRGLTGSVLQEWELGYAPDVGDALASHLKRKGYSLAECKSLFLVDEDQVGGYFDKFRGRLMFPIRDEAGHLVAFGGRLLGDGHPKYINSGDTPLYRKSRVLYGMYNARDTLTKKKRAVLVEGYLDVIACHRAGVKEALASLGTTLAEEHARLLGRWVEEVVILYDSDAAGQKAADRAVEILRKEKIRTRIALMPNGEDPDTLLRTAGPAAVQQSVDTGLRPTDYRVGKLLQSSTPEQEEFWTQAVEILAEERSEMLLDKYIVSLAARYPGATDQMSAQKALRREVLRLQKRRNSSSSQEAPAKALPPFKSLQKLHAAEMTIFKALVDPALRQLAHSACHRSDLFVTPDGKAVAEAIKKAFPDQPPPGSPSTWVSAIEPESERETFMVAQYDPRLESLTAEFLEDTMQLLHRRAERRNVSRLKEAPKSDESLLEINNRLRKLKGSSD